MVKYGDSVDSSYMIFVLCIFENFHISNIEQKINS